MCFSLLLPALAGGGGGGGGRGGGGGGGGGGRGGGAGGGGAGGTGNSLYAAQGQVAPVTFTVDPITGTIIFITNPDNETNVMTALQALDPQIREVLIKVVFLEVTYNKGLDIGVEGGLTHNLNGSQTLSFSNLFGLATMGIAPTQGVNTLAGASMLTLTGDNFSAFVRAISEYGKVEVLSRPRMLGRERTSTLPYSEIARTKAEKLSPVSVSMDAPARVLTPWVGAMPMVASPNKLLKLKVLAAIQVVGEAAFDADIQALIIGDLEEDHLDEDLAYLGVQGLQGGHHVGLVVRVGDEDDRAGDRVHGKCHGSDLPLRRVEAVAGAARAAAARAAAAPAAAAAAAAAAPAAAAAATRQSGQKQGETHQRDEAVCEAEFMGQCAVYCGAGRGLGVRCGGQRTARPTLATLAAWRKRTGYYLGCCHHNVICQRISTRRLRTRPAAAAAAADGRLGAGGLLLRGCLHALGQGVLLSGSARASAIGLREQVRQRADEVQNIGIHGSVNEYLDMARRVLV